MTDPAVPKYTGAAGNTGGGDNIFNYPITGSPSNTIYGQMLMYTGVLMPSGGGYVDTSFLHGVGPSSTMKQGPPSTGQQTEKGLGGVLGFLNDPLGLNGRPQETYTDPGKFYAVARGNGLPNPQAPGTGTPSFEQVPVSQFVASFANQNGDQIKDLQSKLVKANLLNGNFTYGLYDDATRAAVFHLAVYTAAKNDPHIDFFTMLNSSIKMQQQMAGQAAQTTVTHDSQTVFSDPVQAKALVTATMAQLLGRNPSDDEMKQMAASLHAGEAAHPDKTTTKTQTNNLGQIINRTSTETQGLDDTGRQYLLQQQAQQNPDYQRYQQVALYGPAFMSMLGPTTAAGSGSG